MSGAVRLDEGKVPLWLLPWDSIQHLVQPGRLDIVLALHLWVRRYPGYIMALSSAMTTERAEQASRVMLAGLVKYPAFNWEHGLAFSRIASSGLRHAISAGDDPETGLPHAWHCAANLAMAIHHARVFFGTEFDDRPKPR